MCKSNGIWLSVLFALLLVLAPAISYSQSPSPLTPPNSGQIAQPQQQRLAELMQVLVTLRLLSLQLGQDLETWPLQIQSLQANSAQLSQQLTDSQKSLADSQSQQAQTQAALDKLQASQTELSQSLENYKDSAAKVQADLQAQVAQERASKLKWEIGGSIAAAVLVGIAGYEGGHALKLW